MSRTPSPYAPTVIAAVIIGGSILIGGRMVQTSLAELQTGLSEATAALEEVAKAGPAPAAADRRGPDPNKRHTIKYDGAPTKGPDTAKVKIAEFSDFQ